MYHTQMHLALKKDKTQGSQLKKHQCIRRKHVGCQLKGPNLSSSNVLGTNMLGANLTPFSSKNTPNLPFLVEEAQINFFNFVFALSTVGSCPRLLGEYVQNISQHLTAWIVRLLHLKWK
jgi:hypothetical protein